MTIIRVKENEPFEVAMRRFKRTIEKNGLLTELRAREFYEKPTAERKRKKAAAVKRHYKRIRSQTLPKKLYLTMLAPRGSRSGAPAASVRAADAGSSNPLETLSQAGFCVDACRRASDSRFLPG